MPRHHQHPLPAGFGRAASTATATKPPAQAQFNANAFVPNPGLYQQNPGNFASQNLVFQNPNITIQNPIYPFQNPSFSVQQQNIDTNLYGNLSNLYIQNTNFPIPNPIFPVQNPKFTAQPQNATPNRREALEKIEASVAKARRELIASGESVSTWKVSQSALVTLQADSLESLGFQLQEVPSLHHLIVVEGKINAFISCYVAVWRITSLYDLELAICKNEGIEKFEELELGPLVRHPLVMHYFSVNSDVTDVYHITSQEVISYLSEFIDARKGRSFKVDEFLDFIAKKCKVTGWEKLGVRIQSLGMHITFIREAQSSEDSVLQKCLKTVEKNSGKKRKKRPLFSLEKQQLDKRFSNITQRITSFSSAHEDFFGKHTRFVSSCSDDDDTDVGNCEEREGDSSKQKACHFSSVDKKSSDRVSSCPYPSAAEEMARLGLKGESDGSSFPVHKSSNCLRNQSRNNKQKLERKKRKSEEQTSSTLSLKKPLSREKIDPNALSNDSWDEMEQSYFNEADLSFANDSIRMFITTWKEVCQEHTSAEVFNKLLQFYDASHQQKKMLKSVFSTYPFLGLLNVAVTSIKNGMWDSIYDTFQSIGELGETCTHADKCTEYASIDVGPKEKDPRTAMNILGHDPYVTVDDIVRKVKEYFAIENSFRTSANSLLEKIFIVARKLCHCEVWMAQQFSVNEFKSLGYGEYFAFLEQHASVLLKELHEFVKGEVHEHMSLDASMLQQQLVILLSQASSSLWADEGVTKQKISDLLVSQFPLISFTITENGSMEDLLNFLRQHKSSFLSSCVIFSATLLGAYNCNERELSVSTELGASIGQKEGIPGSVTSKDAVEVLLKAPMLSDLNSWSHWDLIYAPSLGPLLGWLLNEVNARDLLCLLTRDGKIIRIDHLASVDSFFEALLQGSPFQVAVKLLSVFSISGGKRHVSSCLLKCHARQAFEVILTNSMESRGVNVGLNCQMDRTLRKIMAGEAASCNLINGFCNNLRNVNEAVSVASKLILDCLSYLPSEFRSFAADILLCGLQSVAKDAPSTVLLQCKNNEERLMLHEVGFSLGIMEWIDDHHASCPMIHNSYIYVHSSSSGAISSKVTGLECGQHTLGKIPYFKENVILSAKEEEHCENDTNFRSYVVVSEVSGKDEMCHAAEENSEKNAGLLIESIRREEFGLDPDLSDEESSVLKKQHARLGRALHCLSQELYSQDSHFLLELVQNADDNVYPEEVEPTLIFILQETGIVVLNNERGFTAKNIRALCDVGNSTKKGSVGYIGQKGIGFKSVFRVTDAPEIHSNGFHIKFDISEGQIGFVLPTIVPSCNIDLFRHLACDGSDNMDANSWNTCIVLPFRSKLSDGVAISSIFSMFSDLNPSLLLFLHRLQCIKLKNMLDDSFIVMRKEIMGDGIIKVSHGKEQMTWFVASKKLHPEVIRPNVQVTEISIAFTLKESVNGCYDPYLEQQPVFAFLPLRTYGLKFILQGDFVLTSSREEIDGDSPWNQWLLSEFPGLFVSAEKLFSSLSCYQENPGKAVTAFMSFVPLIGEVHGYFSCLPRLILSKLRLSNCLLQEGCKDEWVPPCKVLRNWNDQSRLLLPDNFLRKHLGLGFLDKEIILSNSLASALGIEDYGPRILVKFISSLTFAENGLKSVGLSWLSSWLNELYNMLLCSSAQTLQKSGSELDLINSLKKVPFIPLSDGTYGSLHEGSIWFNADSMSVGLNGDHGYEVFPNLYASLRVVNPALFSAATYDASSVDERMVNNTARMLHKIGVQRLSAHEIIKFHILPSIFDDKIADNKHLMAEHLAFVMLHLQSSCVDCYIEREYIISQLRNKVCILTNDGYKKPIEVSIYFSREYGNSIDASKLVHGMDFRWFEVDSVYLKHPVTGLLPCGLVKWREFFQNMGVTDFFKVVQVEKSIPELSPPILQQIMMDGHTVSPGLVVKDWESQELGCILSLLCKNGNMERCKYLLEVLDAFWDEYFSDKTAGYFSCKSGGSNITFKSSFINSICNIQWVASTMDNELHYPRELFYDCDALRSVVGAYAPYAVPKIRSKKLLSDIGFKVQVTADDIFSLLQMWRRLKTAFAASISQMSRFYTFIWNELATSKQKVVEALNSGPFIFLPHVTGNKPEDVVTGIFLSPEEVYWSDFTGVSDHMKQLNTSTRESNCPLSKTLCNIYPVLHDFFVLQCGVNENPPFRHYIQILQQLSDNSLPLEAAKSVFQVILTWSDGLKCGAVSSDDIIYFRECLLQLDFTVLPTMVDKWVSLHPSFGLVCWCDDDMLKEEFKHSDNIEFLYFGELNDDEKEMLLTKVSLLMRALGIPSLSEVVTREAIYYGPADGSFKASLVVWALPFVQRYIYNVHPEKYEQLKLSSCEFDHLRVVVVEKLFYRNVIKRCDSVSKKRSECSCLLQGNILYSTQESDLHTIFMELSRLFFNGAPDLHLANFLHMIATMTESGSSEQQMESFILNSQNMLKLPDEESVWSLSLENNEKLPLTGASTNINEHHSLNSKKRPGISSWPPVGWKTAPGFGNSHANWFRSKTVITNGSHQVVKNECESIGVALQNANLIPTDIDDDLVIEDEVVAPTTKDGIAADISEALQVQSDAACNQAFSSLDLSLWPLNVVAESLSPEAGPSKPSEKISLLSQPMLNRRY
ncbi:hypothetical protein Nepgr_022125 [Nepenthes gracilis]|uniref:Sacsin/Nov domain-containing protein n=1 Tax=Nepenthes gracilis TaxID=150966 RepID=A0AAD3T0A4_NEPGR|nr:hypothetical protein Nepgr_022125 [Nepenthes gracilis]